MTQTKRLFDLALALLLTLLLAPLLITLLIWLWLRQGRPLLHASERMKGIDQPFKLWKLRTMKVVPHDAGVTGGDKTARITAAGIWLRATRLDELPQLWNILRGDMSFVGPRPPLRQYVTRFPDLYRAVLQSRPGVTGLASLVCHQREAAQLARCATPAETDAVYARIWVARKARLDLIYQRHQSLRYDFALILRTVATLFHRPAPQKRQPAAAQDFLGRAPWDGDLDDARDCYTGRCVLISGAGGSIGSELCRQVLACRPARLVLFEQSEPALYTIDRALRQLAKGRGCDIVPVLGSVCDSAHVRKMLGDHAVQVVLHAAAYKHVPLVEANPLPALANNVLGTHVLASAAADLGVERFILISSDKAVRPASVMGASKRLAELVVQDLASRHRASVFAMVRFGNVLGSSGSVLPLFQEQVRRGGPVTVTDPRAARFFMTLREAVHLVLKAGAEASGGEVFVLDMGAPVPIIRLARQVIERASLSVRDAATPDGDIEIAITGLRPGEKLTEELTLTKALNPTRYHKIFCARDAHLSEIEVASMLRGLRAALAAGDEAGALTLARRWVEGYGAGGAARKTC